ncbi:hypothetical protein AT251_02135 [Enterovibrio nigricans]|nr:hypothetical protein AT251_02135 [Enterovibrio nigricans]
MFGYMSVAALLLFTGVWPLEIKVLLIAFLSKELKHSAHAALAVVGDFSLHTDGHCHWEHCDYHVRSVVFKSPVGFVLDVHRTGEIKRIPLLYDACSEQDFRHLSRICLELKE